MSKTLVLLSGGIDSATCLAKAINDCGRDNVVALSIAYGQKHSKELEAAKKIATFYGIENFTLNLANIFEHSDSTLLMERNNITQGAYSEQLKKEPILSTYVPFRNGLFISTAASFAISKHCGQVWYGAHSDDAAQNAYPDCSEEFVNSMQAALFIGSGKTLTLCAPFVTCEKKDIVALGKRLGVPFELTWSCYEGNDRPCRKCGTCKDREKAFTACGLSDPLLEEQ